VNDNLDMSDGNSSPSGRSGGALIAILGGGESGVGAAILAQQKGFEVFVSDKGKIKEKYKIVLTSIGVEWDFNSYYSCKKSRYT